MSEYDSNSHLHSIRDLKYWAKRWEDCFPCTYPPELYETIFIEKTTGWGPFKQEITIEKHVCARCKELICTGHQCRDVLNYIIESRLNV